jgi:ABC-type transporter Mla subunit MlaD
VSSSAGERRTKPVLRRGAAAGLLASALVVAATAVVVLLATAGGGGGGGYQVRAIFTYAANISIGENVKIAGVPVGTVGEVTATPQGLAAVSLHISNPGFQEFRKGATCRVRPQSFLGEKYVECVPVQPHTEGQPLPPAIPAIPQGHEGAGEHLIPVSDTESPTEVDQLQDITREPESQLLRIVLNELGATFATRGPELRKLIIRANPGLRELDKVLKIFREQNHVLANLAEEGDKALAPLAANRGHIVDFIDKSNTLAQATTRHLQALESDLAQFPAFFKQFRPAIERLGRFGEQALPTFTNLDVAAEPLGKAFEELGPFSKSSDEYFTSLGETGKRTGPALKAVVPLLNELETLGGAAKPFAGNAAKLFTSLKTTGGIERLLDFIFLGTGATNGYDSLGHFLRAEILGSICVSYKISSPNCPAKFAAGKQEAEASATGTSATAAKYSGMSIRMARTLAVLEGATPQEAIAAFPGEGTAGSGTSSAQTSKPVGGTASGTTYYAPGAEDPAISERLLEYLLGS